MSAGFGIRYDVPQSLEQVRQAFDGLSICEIKAENINALLEQKISEKVLSDCLLFASSQPQDAKTRYFKKNAELPRTLVMTEHCFYILLKGKDKQPSHENWTTRRTVAIRIQKDTEVSLVYQFVNLDLAPCLSDAELTLRKAEVLDTYDYIKEKDGKTYTKTTAFVKQWAACTLDPSRDNEEYVIHEFDNKSRLYLEKSVTFFYNAGSLLEQYVARNDQRSVLFLRGKSTIDERRDAIVTAAKGGNVDMLKLLVRRGDSAQYLAEAFRCSIRSDHVPATKFLLDYGCAETPFFFEALNPNSTIEMITILLEHVEHTEENITHALVQSFVIEKPQFVDLILKMKRKDVPISPRALAVAVFYNSLELVHTLSNHPDTSQNRFGCAIVAACEKQDNGMLELLFSLGARRDLGFACMEAATTGANLNLVRQVCKLGKIAQEDLIQAYRATPSYIKDVREYLLSLIDIEEYNEQCMAKIFDATECGRDEEAADLATQLLP